LNSPTKHHRFPTEWRFPLNFDEITIQSGMPPTPKQNKKTRAEAKLSSLFMQKTRVAGFAYFVALYGSVLITNGK